MGTESLNSMYQRLLDNNPPVQEQEAVPDEEQVTDEELQHLNNINLDELLEESDTESNTSDESGIVLDKSFDKTSSFINGFPFDL